MFQKGGVMSLKGLVFLAIILLITIPAYSQLSATLFDPPESSYTACTDQTVKILITHTLDIVPDSLVFRIGGRVYRWGDPELSISYDTLIFTPPRTDFFSSGVVTIVIDSILDVGGNYSGVDTFVFFVDTDPPIIRGSSPGNGSIVGSPVVRITIALRDAYDDQPFASGLDTSSVNITLTTSLGTYDVTSYALSHVDTVGDIHINALEAGVAMMDEDSVTVTVIASDNVDTSHCGPNTLSAQFTFYVTPVQCRVTRNPITPNGDGFNDVTSFEFSNIRNTTKNIEVLIYDRIERLVRTVKRSAEGFIWDGMDENGDPVPQGVYIYVVIVDGDAVCSGTISVAK